jgi:hypothetical protein
VQNYLIHEYTIRLNKIYKLMINRNQHIWSRNLCSFNLISLNHSHYLVIITSLFSLVANFSMCSVKCSTIFSIAEKERTQNNSIELFEWKYPKTFQNPKTIKTPKEPKITMPIFSREGSIFWSGHPQFWTIELNLLNEKANARTKKIVSTMKLSCNSES